jgi:nuclear receptor subfamily 1 group D protein 3
LNPNPQPLTGQQELLQDFSKRFSPAIRGVVEFAKRIPGFALLPQDDQVTLLKAGVFEVLLVRLACMFDAQVSVFHMINLQVTVCCYYKGISKSFQTGRLERELQMAELSATRCSCIAIL